VTRSETPRYRRILRWALGLSLALNLLILGAVGGALWRHGGPGQGPRGGMPGLHSYASPYVRALPAEARQDLHREMRAGMQAQNASREARRAQYDEMLASLRAEPFDPAKAKAVLAEQGAAVATVQEAAHAAWLAQVASMSPEARGKYADALESQLQAKAQDRSKRPRKEP